MTAISGDSRFLCFALSFGSDPASAVWIPLRSLQAWSASAPPGHRRVDRAFGLGIDSREPVQGAVLSRRGRGKLGAPALLGRARGISPQRPSAFLPVRHPGLCRSQPRERSRRREEPKALFGIPLRRPLGRGRFRDRPGRPSARGSLRGAAQPRRVFRSSSPEGFLALRAILSRSAKLSGRLGERPRPIPLSLLPRPAACAAPFLWHTIPK